jgi:hypothetical protein
VVLFSLWQGAYDIDPHHWGLMLSNAKDLYEGQTPYKDIFIQYGILTTILQTFAFGLGKNMLSIIVITSICYVIGILLVYATALNVLKNKTTALYVFILLVLFHPLAMYPWSNYIAFPFFMYGVYVLTNPNIDQRKQTIQLLLAGISLGLSVLAREGLAPAAFLFILLCFAFDLIKNAEKKKALAQFALCTIGFVIPLGVFFTYLFASGLIEYWVKLSINLPAIYVNESFGGIKVFIFKALFKEIYTGYRHGDVRWILTSWILLSSLWIFVLALIGKRKDYVTPGVAKIALASLLLVSSSLHLAETFRIATGSAVGLICLFAFLNARENKSTAKYFFTFMALWLGLTATYGNRGNYFFPTWNTVINAQTVTAPAVLRGQLWSSDTSNYYQEIQSTLMQLQQAPCQIDFQVNKTRDSLFKVISPITQLQPAPFAVNDTVAALRPDLDAKAAIIQGKRIVILESVDKAIYDKTPTPKGFSLLKHLTVPEQHFMPHQQELLMYVPQECAK